MMALWVQTLLLMAAAYFVGAALACMIRRSSSTAVQPSAAERRVDPLPESVRHEAEAARFGRATEPPRAPRSAPPAPAASPAQPPAAAPAADTSPQDLKRIRLIDAPVEASLIKLGINRYEHMAAWMQADVQRVDQALADKGRVNRENWIEQAQILAKGGETHYSARRARGEAASAVPTPDEGERGPPAPAAPLPRAMSRAGVAAVVVAPPLTETRPAVPPSPPLVAERAAFAGRQRSSARATEDEAEPETNALDVVASAVPVRPAASPTQDNLQRIGGITPEIEQELNAQGVSRYSQIAQWAPADVERFDKQLLTGGRIARENWVEQAQILSRGGDTRFSREFDRPPRPIKLPDAIREQQEAAKTDGARTDLGSLRSVRSEAYQNAPEPGPEAAQRVAARNRVKRAAAPDDLKRIRGIGVLIEKRLGSLGVSSYEQIANWTAQDIERVSKALDFKGRIERDNWVEQARILASGGTTEFSRRVDRGEVETSRAKT